MPKLVKYAGIVFFLSLIARTSGFFRNILFVNKCGVGEISDSFFVSIAAVDFFILFFGLNALKSVTTTVYSQERALKHDTGSFLSSILLTAAFLGLVLSVPMLVLPGLLSRLFAPGFSGNALDITAMCLRLTAFLVLFKGIMPIFESLLGVQKKFAAQNIFTPFINLVSVTAILIAPQEHVLAVFCISLTASFGLACAGSYLAVTWRIRLPLLTWQEYRQQAIKFARLSFPLLFATTSYSLAEIADRMIATFFQKGAVTSMGVAHTLCFMSTFVLLEPIAKVLFPHFSRLFFEKRHDQLAKDFNLGQLVIALTFIPVSFFFIFFSRDIVSAVLVTRKISSVDINTASRMLSVYAAALIFSAGFFLPSFLLQSAQKNSFVGKVSGAVFIGKVLCSIIFSYFWGYIGIPIGTLVAFMVNCVLLTAGVHMHLQISVSKNLIAAISGAAAVSCVALLIAYMVHLPHQWLTSAPAILIPAAQCAAKLAVYAVVSGGLIYLIFRRHIIAVFQLKSA
jgi:putative peptidoglycan lipid II flippase